MSLLQYSRQERITGQPQKPQEACLQRQYAPPKDPICRQFAVGPGSQAFESDDGVGCGALCSEGEYIEPNLYYLYYLYLYFL